MLHIIIGNICSVGAMLCDSYSGTRKTKKEILLVQSISQVFYIAATLILKGYSATVQNIATVFRNTYAVYGKRSKLVDWVFILLPVVFGLVFNNRSWLGVLPVAANLQYSLAVMFCGNSPRMLKYSFIVVCILFSVFNFAILNFVSGAACIFTAVVTVISLVKEKHSRSAE